METKLSAKRQEIRVELEAGGRTIAAGTGDEMDWIRGVARVAAEAAESVAGIHASAYALPSGAQATAQAVYDPKGIALTIGIPAGAAGQDGAPGQDGLDAPQIDDTQASEDNPWSGQKVQQELDALTAADVEAYPDGGIRSLTFSIASSAWAGAGPYTYTITDSGVTANTWCTFELTSAVQALLTADIAWTTSAGQIALSTQAKPAGTMSGTILLMEVSA